MREDEYVEGGIQQLSDYRESVHEYADANFAAVRQLATRARSEPTLEPMPRGSIFGRVVARHDAMNGRLEAADEGLMGWMVDSARRLGVEPPADVAALVDPEER
jgi:hypothetical protein